ncbi:MAG: class I SAM-dependent methyltransferase [Burkholderiaceae bacterium]|nr:class I SAM-dependent methyltransferase [Burkholderiaceae bacterium]
MSGGRFFSIPAVQAALVQLVALPTSYFLLSALEMVRVPVTFAVFALVQAAVALVFTWKLGLAPWWRVIQFVFPLAVLLALALALPPLFYLLVFLLLLGVYWSTYRTQVPLYNSGVAVWRAVERELPSRPGLNLIDIGSGLGGMALHLARARADALVTGIELAPLPWLLSRLRARLTGSTARFVRGDYETLDFSAYDLVFAYLSPAAMPGLWAKARREMRPGSLLISYEFEIANCPPDKTIVTTEHGPALHVWRF